MLLLRGQISNLARIWLLAFALSISALAEPPSHTNPLRYVDQKAAAGCALINKADEAVDVYDALARRTLSTVAFHTGQNLPGDVLSLIGKKDPARVALGMLNAAQNYQTNPDYFDIDRGQFMAVLGEVFTHLVKDKKAKAITEKVRRFLTKGVTYLDEHPEVVKAFEEGDDAAISQSVNSLFASVAARARGDLQNKLEKRLFETQERLMTAKEWQQIARLKTPKVAELLLLAPVDERDAYLKTYLNNMVNEKTGLQPELIPLLQELSRSPSTQKMANNILANFGLAGNKDIRKGRLGQGLLGLKDDFLKRGADTLKLLQDLAPDLADAAHVALSLGTLGGPHAALYCGATNSLFYALEGNDREAIAAALEMIPGLTHFNGTGNLAKLKKLALLYEKYVNRFVRLKQQADDVDRLMGTARDGVEKWQQSNPEYKDEVLASAWKLAAPRIKMPRLVTKLQTIFSETQIEGTPAYELAEALTTPGKSIGNAADNLCSNKKSPAAKAITFLRKSIEEPFCKIRDSKVGQFVSAGRGMFETARRPAPIVPLETTPQFSAEVQYLGKTYGLDEAGKKELATKITGPDSDIFSTYNYEKHAVARAIAYQRANPTPRPVSPYFPSAATYGSYLNR